MFMAESEPLGEALQEAEKAFMKSLGVLEEKLEGTTDGERWEAGQGPLGSHGLVSPPLKVGQGLWGV